MRIKGKRNVVFKPEQREFTHFAERSNEKELNDKITLLYNFYMQKSEGARILTPPEKQPNFHYCPNGTR